MENRPELHTNEKVIEFLKRVKQDSQKEMSRELILLKLNNLQELIDEIEEALHYANQDLTHSEKNYQIDATTKEQRENVFILERELAEYKRQWSELNSKL